MCPSDAATRVNAARPPPEIATFSALYLLPMPRRNSSL
jgi:hypothetical protein